MVRTKRYKKDLVAAKEAAKASAALLRKQKATEEFLRKQEASAAKYHGCAEEELLNKLQQVREHLKDILEKKNATLSKSVKRKHNLENRVHRRELAELQRELRRRSAPAICQNPVSAMSMQDSAADDGVGDNGFSEDASAGEAVVFSSTDDDTASAPFPCHPGARSGKCCSVAAAVSCVKLLPLMPLQPQHNQLQLPSALLRYYARAPLRLSLPLPSHLLPRSGRPKSGRDLMLSFSIPLAIHRC
jgi:hypothetical protein